MTCAIFTVSLVVLWSAIFNGEKSVMIALVKIGNAINDVAIYFLSMKSLMKINCELIGGKYFYGYEFLSPF